MNYQASDTVQGLIPVAFERETANPINQEARILDLVARPVVAKIFHACSVHFCALVSHVFYGGQIIVLFTIEWMLMAIIFMMHLG